VGRKAAVAGPERLHEPDAALGVVLLHERGLVRLDVLRGEQRPSARGLRLGVEHAELLGGLRRRRAARVVQLEEHARVVVRGARGLLAEGRRGEQLGRPVELVDRVGVAAGRVAADAASERRWELVAVRRARDDELGAAADRNAAVAALEGLDHGQPLARVVEGHEELLPGLDLRRRRRPPATAGVAAVVVDPERDAHDRAAAARGCRAQQAQQQARAPGDEGHVRARWFEEVLSLIHSAFKVSAATTVLRVTQHRLSFTFTKRMEKVIYCIRSRNFILRSFGKRTQEGKALVGIGRLVHATAVTSGKFGGK
jgi:hypothetical protein